jgi:protein phosphatase
LHADEMTRFNVGDSRIYLFRDRVLSQLSTDHVLQPGDDARNRQSHVITQAVGGSYQTSDIWPAIGSMNLRGSDRLLLCSDGLNEVVTDEFIAQIFERHITTDAIVRELVNATFEQGAPDNIRVMVAGGTR